MSLLDQFGTRTIGEVNAARIDATGERGRRSVAIPTRWRTILSLELQGRTKREIAEHLHISAASVSDITSRADYIAERDKLFGGLDGDFLRMKPLAFRALRNGLTNADEHLALRAAETWFKGANFGGYSKHDQPAANLSAEDVARQLVIAAQVNVTVNTKS